MDSRQKEWGEKEIMTWESFLFLCLFCFWFCFVFPCQSQKGIWILLQTPKTRGLWWPPAAGSCDLITSWTSPFLLGEPCANTTAWSSCSVAKVLLPFLFIWECELWGICFAAFFFFKKQICCHKSIPCRRPELIKEQDEMLRQVGPHAFPWGWTMFCVPSPLLPHPTPPPSPPYFVVICLPLTVSFNLQEGNPLAQGHLKIWNALVLSLYGRFWFFARETELEQSGFQCSIMHCLKSHTARIISESHFWHQNDAWTLGSYWQPRSFQGLFLRLCCDVTHEHGNGSNVLRTASLGTYLSPHLRISLVCPLVESIEIWIYLKPNPFFSLQMVFLTLFFIMIWVHMVPLVSLTMLDGKTKFKPWVTALQTWSGCLEFCNLLLGSFV